ncbi:FAD-dependent oxidoreductase [Clostridium sp. YIM B02505]|uniref:FAD-dependent oxidoreductase n=1 Tax=Clostridium yunnanense TaxID=2800325 RepID=A0ABS1EK66_9CLOT|nr:FAD-dependent oxidoreductase [Clostridium yunnanense]MBK1809763.1 FAD-dependent oxidoreductase [Clostridium yunnanense]
MIKHNIRIIDIVDEAKYTKTYYFEKPEDFTWEEGAHTHIAHVGFDAGDKPNKDLVRHMSIMTLPKENKVGITTRFSSIPSEFKDKLSNLAIGDEVVLFKVGSLMTLKRNGRPLILLSMGVGIAAMRPIILAFKEDGSNIPYVININVDSSGDFIYKDELDNLVDESYKNYWISDRQGFYKKLDQLLQIEKPVFYIVGSYEFVKSNIRMLISNNVNGEDISIDKKEWSLSEFLDNSKV